MAINLISPGVKITETDQVASVSSVGTTSGGVVGRFRWGPMEKAVLVQSETELVDRFGAPNATNNVDFLVAANYLAYSPNLNVVRIANANALNATAEATTGSETDGTGLLIKNDDVYEVSYASGQGDVGPWAAKYPGALGNSIKVSICPSSAAWQSTLTGDYTVAAGSTTVVGANSATANTELTVGDLVVIGGRTLKVAAVTNATHFTTETAHISGATAVTVTRRWEFFGNFDAAPGTTVYTSSRGGSNDEMHIAVVDEDGLITGVAGTLLEKFQELSKASDAKAETGGSTYYKDVIANRSNYIRWMDHLSAGSNWGNTASGTTFTAVNAPANFSLAGGSDGSTPTDVEKIAAYNIFANKSNITLSVLPLGVASATVINTVIADIAEVRKDLVVLFSPRRTDVVNAAGSEVSNITGFTATVTRSTYAVADSNWKYQYDKYNDVYVYVPCNADVAGCMARTDAARSPWSSPAGYTNGRILNVVRLAWNPNEGERDLLYKDAVNAIFTQTGRGTVLFGDKTFTLKTSSFNRINVRRLFIELQRVIGELSGNVLFDENNQATRAGFVNQVEPYLRDVQALRGITDFRVICDESNNPDNVVNANEFICDIFVRPVSSVNFIQLNFVSVRGSASFAEIAG
jgi:hypothetical protein